MKQIYRLISLLLALSLCLAGLAFSEGSAPKYPTLSEGMEGKEVLELQKALMIMYYNVGDVPYVYTEQTKWAVASFQKLNGLEVTGIADAKTQEVLFSGSAIAAPSPSPTPKPTPTPTPKPTAKPKSKSSSSSGSKLSAADCKDIGIAYVYMRYGNVNIVMSDVNTDNQYGYVAVTFSQGAWSYGAIVVVVDRKTGAVVTTRSVVS